MVDLAEAWATTQGDISARLTSLRCRTVQRARPIPARAVKRLWGQRMVLSAALIAADDPATPRPLRILCRAVYDNLMGDLFADLDPADPSQGPQIAAFLDGLQAAGVLSVDVRAETLALAFEHVLEFPGLGLPDLQIAGVITASEAGVEE